MMRPEIFSGVRASALQIVFALSTSNCGGKALDLGDNGGESPPSGSGGRSIQDGGVVVKDPEVVAPEQFGADLLAVDESRAYWSTPSPRSCRLDDCKRSMTTYGGPDDNTALLLINSTTLFFSRGNDDVIACPKSGCVGSPSALNFGSGWYSRLFQDETFTVDDSNAYWILDDATVQRAPLSGTGQSGLVATLAANPVVLLADDSTLYIGTKSPTESSIVAVPKDGSSLARNIFTGQFEPTALAVDTNRIYWTDASAGTVSACPLAGCKSDPDILCTGQHSPGRLLVDERNAYWIEFGDPSERSKIVECPLDGCGSSPRVLASQQVLNGRGFAQDTDHVYWTTTIGGHGKRDAGGPDTKGSVSRIGK